MPAESQHKENELINQVLSKNEIHLASIEKKMEENEKQLEILSGQVSQENHALLDTVERTKIPLTELQEQILEDREQTGALMEQANRIDSQIHTIEDYVRSLETKADTIGERSQSIESRMGTLDERAQGTEGQIRAVNDRVQSVEQKAITIVDRTQSIEQRITAIDDKVQSVEIHVEGLRGYVNDHFETLRKELFKQIPKPVLELELHITEQCNLNCKMCSHFSCLAEEEYLSLEQFERDMARLAEIFDNGMKHIRLLGGEPLLHPQLLDFFRIGRSYFPENRIEMLTNGLLLPQQGEAFWNCCREEGIVINCTKYPINLDYEKITAIAGEYHVKLEFNDNTDQVIKTLHKLPLDLEGLQDPRSSFISCFHANNCVCLYHGRLFTCVVAPNARHFNRYFGTKLCLSERDSIDIYKAKNAQEICAFLAQPIPFCRYCKVQERTFGHPWGLSEKKISEWT